MVQVQERDGPMLKLSGKFTGPFRAEEKLHGNKFCVSVELRGTHLWPIQRNLFSFLIYI